MATKFEQVMFVFVKRTDIMLSVRRDNNLCLNNFKLNAPYIRI